MVLSARVEEAGSKPPAEVPAGELKASGSARLWFALGAPPLAWFAALNTAYFFVSWACARTNGEAILHLITGCALLVSLAAGLAAWGVLRAVGAHGDDDHDDRVQRTRFLARFALASALIFSLVLITQWIAIVIQEPCMPYPRSRFTPDA